MKTLPNNLLIEGHTDATRYSSDASYTNWELSADRANSARRLLQQDGVRANQVTQVRGYADQMLRVKNNPYDPSNRRVSILVKNQNGAMLGPKGAGGANGPAAAPAIQAKLATKKYSSGRRPVLSGGVFNHALAELDPQEAAPANHAKMWEELTPSGVNGVLWCAGKKAFTGG